MEVTNQQVENALDCAGLERRQLYATYSGRCMYGEHCIGITGTSDDGARFLLYLTAEKFTNDYDTQRYAPDVIDQFIQAYEKWPESRTDNMGRDMITYWPDLQLLDPDAWKEEHDED